MVTKDSPIEPKLVEKDFDAEESEKMKPEDMLPGGFSDIEAAIKRILSGKEDTVSTVGCCITYMLYGGTVVNPVRNMETSGRQLTVEFNIKLL